MEDQYDTDAFIIFVIAILCIYILGASIFLYKRIRRLNSKEPIKKRRSTELVEVEEQAVESPLTIAFWINLVLVILAIVLVVKLTNRATVEEAEVMDPYSILSIPIGSSEKTIKSAYRKMAKIYHPDKPTGSEEKFREVEMAYRILTDEIARSNWERYGNPDGPASVSVGIALPSWMMEASGKRIMLIGYLLLMIVGIPLFVWCIKSRSNSKEKAPVSDKTIGGFYHAMNESMPIQCLPEILSTADEYVTTAVMKPYDNDLLTYFYKMCPKNASFSTTLMKKPKVPIEKIKDDAIVAAFYKTDILIHAYLNHLEVSSFHQQDIQEILAKAPKLLQVMFELSLYPRMKGKPPSFTLCEMVLHFHQYMYQGLWIEDSPLKQLPYMDDKECRANKNRNRQLELREFMNTDPAKWKGLGNFLDSQLLELKQVVKSIPHMNVKAHFEVEDEEDIFVGDVVTCVIEIVRSNLIPKEHTVEDVFKEHGVVEKEEEEEEEEAKDAKAVDYSEIVKANTMDIEDFQPTPGFVYSKRFPYKMHEHWYAILTDREDKYMENFTMIRDPAVYVEDRQLKIQPRKEGTYTYHLHFICPVYMGLDFVHVVTIKVKPESLKPKIEINEKDLELDKKRGIMDMLNNEAEEVDEDWNSSEEEEEEEEEEGAEEAEEVKEDIPKNLSKKEKQRLYHLKKKEQMLKEKARQAKEEADKTSEDVKGE